jgi:hypothetical protein
MKYIPILFSTAMVQALLAGRKTMTRRVIKPQPNMSEGRYDGISELDFEDCTEECHFLEHTENGKPLERYYNLGKCPYGKVGDVLWVRENYKLYINYDNQVYVQFEGRETFDVYNKKDISLSTLQKIVARKLKPNEWHSCPSIHLYKEFASIFLKITDIRVERLQDIGEQEAVKEGISNNETKYYDYLRKEFITESAYHSFFTLWESINGEASWDANPWVWVIKFEQIEKPEDFK